MTQVVMRQAGGLRSGLMFYADGNTRDGMVDMISGSPGLIVGAGGSMVVRPESRGWGYVNDPYVWGLLMFNSPALERLGNAEAISMWYWGTTDENYIPRRFIALGKKGGGNVFAVKNESEAEFWVDLNANGASDVRGTDGDKVLTGLHQYGITWKQGGVTCFYRDGILVYTNTTPNLYALDRADGVVTLGNVMDDLTAYMSGMVCGAAIWGRELSQDDFALLANDPLALRRMCWRKKMLMGG